LHKLIIGVSSVGVELLVKQFSSLPNLQPYSPFGACVCQPIGGYLLKVQ